MTDTYSKVKTISEDTDLQQWQVAEVLYDYLSWCLQEVLIDGETKTIFGKITLDKNDRIHLDTDKYGLISLIGKNDRKLIRKIAEEGPDSKIFDM